jgi:hypothetical protein
LPIAANELPMLSSGKVDLPGLRAWVSERWQEG